MAYAKGVFGRKLNDFPQKIFENFFLGINQPQKLFSPLPPKKGSPSKITTKAENYFFRST